MLASSRSRSVTAYPPGGSRSTSALPGGDVAIAARPGSGLQQEDDEQDDGDDERGDGDRAGVHDAASKRG
jgi:hypothetical protein